MSIYEKKKAEIETELSKLDSLKSFFDKLDFLSEYFGSINVSFLKDYTNIYAMYWIREGITPIATVHEELLQTLREFGEPIVFSNPTDQDIRYVIGNISCWLYLPYVPEARALISSLFDWDNNKNFVKDNTPSYYDSNIKHVLCADEVREMYEKGDLSGFFQEKR